MPVPVTKQEGAAGYYGRVALETIGCMGPAIIGACAVLVNLSAYHSVINAVQSGVWSVEANSLVQFDAGLAVLGVALVGANLLIKRLRRNRH